MTFQPDKKKAGLAEACSELVRRRRAGEAQDVVQDACVRALQADARRNVQDPMRYVLRIVRNLFIDESRKRSREGMLFEYSEHISFAAGNELDPERILTGKQSLAGILAAIELLPPRCREAFVLHRFEELSYPAIARRMGISISMVEKHIAEAMARLLRTLKEQTP